MSDSVELIPDTDSNKTMDEVQAASSAVAPPSGVGRPLPAGNGLPSSVGGDDRPRLSMYQDNREFVQQINIMNNMSDYAEMRYAVTGKKTPNGYGQIPTSSGSHRCKS